jgi:uncharacterized protein (UPF0332 family)
VTTAADALARRRIARAADALRDAEVLVADQRWRGAINRLFYAAFYAAKALLALRGLDTSKHSATIALFQQHFVKPGLVPSEVARGLTRAFDKRQLTDYADLSDPGAEDVQEIDRGVRPLVQFCERFVAEHVGESERDAP